MLLKVALVGPYPADPSRIPGGVAAVTFYVAQGLSNLDDVELHIVSPIKDVDSDRVVEHEKMTVHYLALPKQRVVPNLLTAIGRIEKKLIELQPDVVHSEAGIATLAGQQAGFPTLHTIHGIIHREVPYAKGVQRKLAVMLEGSLTKKAVNRAEHCVAISGYAARAYESITRAKMHFIFNPIEDRFFEIENREVAGKMLSVQMMTRRKNVLGLVKGFERVRQQNPSAVLYLCGKVTDPEYFESVKSYIQSRDLGQSVIIPGFISQEELGRHFSEAAVICLFSYEETAPMVVAQAMCAGKAVVASRAGGTPDLVIDGETGFLVDIDDEAGFAEKSLELLSDPDLCRKMGQRGREVAEERFRIGVVAAQTKLVYDEMLAGR